MTADEAKQALKEGNYFKVFEKERKIRGFNISEMAKFLNMSRCNYYRFKEPDNFENMSIGRFSMLLKKLGYSIEVKKDDK